MQTIRQVLGWSDDTFLIQLDEMIDYEKGITNYILFNYPSDYDLFSFRSMIYPSNKTGELLDFGNPKDSLNFKKVLNNVRDFWILTVED